ncbi:MAG: hypothetical protein AAGI49_06305 [Bacteroidota bacterium]
MIDLDLSHTATDEAADLEATLATGIQLNGASFQFTSYAGEPADANLDFTIFNRLNEQIELKDFGKGIGTISFAFIALAPKFFIKEQAIRYQADHQEIAISLSLDYEQFITATPETAIEMMKALYLKGLRALLLFNIRDFDVEAFIKAVERTLNEEVVE